jgi:hypothetical protein
MTKPTNTDRIESARKSLNAPASKIAELEDAEAVLTHVLVETDAELEGMAGRRRAILAADGPATEIDKQLERHDEAVRTLTRRNEVAAALSTKLATRVGTDREGERAVKRQAAYDEALKLHVTATNRVRDFLDRVGREAREMVREYAQSEIKTAAANDDLPLGAAAIPSIEFERKGKLQPPKTEVGPFKAFVHGMRRIAEQGHVEAAQRSDGQWEIFLPGDSTSGGDYLTCDLVDFVEVTETRDATPWPENLAMALSVPSFFVTERAGWIALESSIPPGSIASALRALESLPPHRYEPRVDTRVMRPAAWRELNGEVVEAEPAPGAVAAE